jgi:tetratricopeptide (TPR) repeat protein
VTSVAENDRDKEALALMDSAQRLIVQGEWVQAAGALERAAALHKEAGRAYDEARCLQLAATLRRSAGEPERARLLADRAAAVAPQDQPLAVSIAAEQAETAFVTGNYGDAIAASSHAIATARTAGLKPEGLSALLRRRAAAWINVGAIEAAEQDFDEACGLLPKETAGFVRTEQANLLLQHGRAEEAERVLSAVSLGADAHLLAEVLVARARLERAAGRLADSLDLASKARDAALQAVAPLSYFAASVQMAEAYEAGNDRVNAYRTLAAAWATLGDLMGVAVARSWVEPVLLAYQFKWGDRPFDQAKRGYEQRRRAVIKTRDNG